MRVVSHCDTSDTKFSLPKHSVEIEIQPGQNLAQCPSGQHVSASSSQRVKLQPEDSTLLWQWHLPLHWVTYCWCRGENAYVGKSLSLAVPTSLRGMFDLQHPVQFVGAEIITSTTPNSWRAAIAGGLSWTGSSACFQLLTALQTIENLWTLSKYYLSM